MTVLQVKELYYKKGLSAREVGEIVNKDPWQVIRFMKQHNLPRRTPAETHNLQFLRKPLSYKIKKGLSIKEEKLKHAGLMLYWAEGVKSLNHVVDFTNSDKRMVLVFLKMLKVIYQIDENRLRVLLYCYANQNIEKLIRHWSRITNIPTNQFFKPYVRQDYNIRKTHKMPFGLVHIRYYDKRLFEQIMKEIGIISRKLVNSN